MYVRSIDAMKSVLLLFAHFLTTLARLLGPGGMKAVLAENLLIKHQLLVLNRSRQRAPALSPWDRMFMGFWTLFMKPRRLLRVAVVIKPPTLLRFHRALIKRKYRLLFSSRHGDKPGPKGPSAEMISAIMAIKQRNPRFGCRDSVAHESHSSSPTPLASRLIKTWCGACWRNTTGPILLSAAVLRG
jgi:hypothetical protein